MKRFGIINSVISGGLALVFLLLRLLWSGFVFFALISLTYMLISWIVLLVINYKEEFFDDFDEKFKFYLVQIINYSNVTSQMIEENPELYRKSFKKTLIKDKLIEIAKMLVLLSLVITFFVAMCTQVF